jgi:hypothetical protein
VAQQPVVIEKFPGLDLRADPGDSRYALDAYNVTLGEGRVRTRDGSTWLASSSGDRPVFAFANARGPAYHLIIAMEGAPGTVTALASTGLALGSTTLADVRANGATAVAIGTATNDYLYVTSPFGGSVVKRWDGAAWTAPAGFPAAVQVLAHSQTDNRLVACVGTRASFSDPGAPETFGANNYVGLGIGDGEQIHGAVWFNNQLFIFKRTKFYAFYGTSTDSTGEPVFNYRAVDSGIGMWAYAPQGVCVGTDGVYFIGNDGIYRTTGGVPTKVSAALDPFFDGTAGDTWPLGVWDPTDVSQRIYWLDDKLHVALATATSKLLATLDTHLNAWTVSSQQTAALSALPVSASEYDAQVLILGGAGDGILQSAPGIATDALTSGTSTSIVSRYRTAFEAMGSPLRKRAREAILEGTGSPRVQWSHDWGAVEAGGIVSLGSGPAPTTGRRRFAVRGRQFSLQVGASSGAWSLNRIQVNVDQPSAPPAVTV